MYSVKHGLGVTTSHYQQYGNNMQHGFVLQHNACGEWVEGGNESCLATMYSVLEVPDLVPPPSNQGLLRGRMRVVLFLSVEPLFSLVMLLPILAPPMPPFPPSAALLNVIWKTRIAFLIQRIRPWLFPLQWLTPAPRAPPWGSTRPTLLRIDASSLHRERRPFSSLRRQILRGDGSRRPRRRAHHSRWLRRCWRE